MTPVCLKERLAAGSRNGHFTDTGDEAQVLRGSFAVAAIFSANRWIGIGL